MRVAGQPVSSSKNLQTRWRRILRGALPTGVLAVMALPAAARPLVLEPSTTVQGPSPWTSIGGPIATNGEDLFVHSAYSVVFDEIREAALHFRKVSGQWQYQGPAVEVTWMEDSTSHSSAFAMEDDLAVVNFAGRARVLRKVGGVWQDVGTSPAGGQDIELDGEAMVSSTGDCQWDAVAHDPNGAGGWTSTYLQGQPRGCDDSFAGGEVDRLGDYVIIGTAYTNDLEDQEVPVYSRTSGSWVRQGSFVAARRQDFTGAVGLREVGTDIEAIVTAVDGAYAYNLFEAAPSPHRLQPPDAYAAGRVRGDRSYQLHGVKVAGGLVFVREGMADRGGLNVINLYRGNRVDGYEHVAVLAGPNGVDLNQEFDVAQGSDGLVVVASGQGDVYEFRLPADLSTPAPRYFDFEDGSAASWTPLMGTFRVIRGGANRFYRQWDSAGEARALLNDSHGVNQAIEADITPREFNGSDRWAGLVTRYSDAQNYYYLTLRSSGSVHLRRMYGGEFVELARAPVTVVIGRPYKLRLESIGTVHRVYLNGELLLDVDDSTLTTPGQAGITMYKTAADFDNVVASPAPYYTIFRTDFAEYAGEWSAGSGQWTRANGVYTQGSVSAEARSLIGANVEDQVVRAKIRPVAYRAPEGAQERWSGLIARYTDDGNYYYVTLRSSNNLSLRKLVNGQIFELASQPYTLNLGTPYDVRLEAVGDQLRVVVNGQPRLQAHDSSHTRGAGGLMTWKTSAEFDDYVAYQP